MPELGRAAGQAVADPLASALEGHLVEVVQDDLAARFEGDLPDPRTHRPGPVDPDGDWTRVAGRPRRGPAHQTVLIDSNGWRQSAQ